MIRQIIANNKLSELLNGQQLHTIREVTKDWPVARDVDKPVSGVVTGLVGKWC